MEKTDFKYSENDITLRSGERDGVYFFSLGEPFVSHSRTVKYKSPDGFICIGGFEINDYSIEVKTGGLFARQRIENEIQEKKREYLKVIDQTVENLSKVLFGDQSYVTCSFRARYDVNLEIGAVLFRDGYLFLNDSFGANGSALEDVSTGRLARMNKDIFEDVLIENIRKINNE